MNIRNNNPGLRFLLQYWQKYCTLDDWHTQWARRYIRVRSKCRRYDSLYAEGERQKNVYIVARGLLARVRYGDRDKRQILSVALPGMALLTTDHLYSHTPSKGDIIVLRSNALVVEISYRAILEFNEQDPQLHTLMSVLTNKKKKQINTLRQISLHQKPSDTYPLFAKEMREVHQILTNQECADLLGISIDTVRRAKKKWSQR